MNGQVEGGEDPQVGLAFFSFLGKPFMGLYDPRSKWGDKLGELEFEFPASSGDNNYGDAPEEEY